MAPSQIIVFSLKGEPLREDVLFSLRLVRHVINLKLTQRRIAGVIDAARLVHEGILPRASSGFSGFEIASAFRPADSVSGDLSTTCQCPSDCCLGRIGISSRQAKLGRGGFHVKG